VPGATLFFLDVLHRHHGVVGPGLRVVPTASKLRRLSLLTIGFILFQLLFGAIYRTTGMMLHMHFLGAVWFSYTYCFSSGAYVKPSI